MNAQARSEESKFVKVHVEAVQQTYPELFACLSKRHVVLRHTLGWISQRRDPEAYISFDRLERPLDDLRSLTPGIAHLVQA